MSTEKPQAASGSDEPKSITFHHLKSNYFRVIHADGVWGGVSPGPNIQMAFYSERGPIPELIRQEITEEGKIGKELDRVSRDGIVREIEASVVMNLEAAKVFVTWLQGKIKQAEQILDKTNREDFTDEFTQEHL